MFIFENAANIGLPQLLLIWAVVVFASVLRSFTGFGFALAAVPVFSLFLSPTHAVVLSVSLTLCISLLSFRTYWGVIPLRPLAPLLAMTLLGTAMGTAALAVISAVQFQLLAGIAVILACVALALFKPSTPWHHPALTWITGMASGLMNGALAIPGPPIIVYAMLTEPQPRRSRALLMTFFLFATLIALASYAVAGFINWQSFIYVLLAMPALYVGNRLGYYLFQRFGDALYRRIALSALFILGLTITLRAIL